MTLAEYFRILREEDIARRYFVMNSFDGTLVVLGVIVAMYFSGINDARIVIISCLGASIAMAVSGIWSAYAAERAERTKSLIELERHLLRDLSETKVSKEMERIAILVALVNGFSPLLVSLVLISPFFISHLGLLPIGFAFYLSIILVIVVLFLIGVFVGIIGKEDIVKSGSKMVMAGIVVGIIMYLLELMKVF